jgi:YheC/D like ATP-grasp
MSPYKIKGKMVKHKSLSQRAELRPYLPELHWYTAQRALIMLDSHSSIFMKPDRGSGGSGIVKINKKGGGTYQIRIGHKRKKVGLSSLRRFLNGYQSPPKTYVVQRGIELARYNGNVFDVRVYLQKPKSVWEVSGLVARVAPRKSYITNYHKGGKAKVLEKVLLPLFAGNYFNVDNCITELKQLSLTIAEELNKIFPDIRELGVDLGVESSGRIWIIEANTRPKHILFTKLPDKSMLDQIRRNKKLIYPSASL